VTRHQPSPQYLRRRRHRRRRRQAGRQRTGGRHPSETPPWHHPRRHLRMARERAPGVSIVRRSRTMLAVAWSRPRMRVGAQPRPHQGPLTALLQLAQTCPKRRGTHAGGTRTSLRPLTGAASQQEARGRPRCRGMREWGRTAAGGVVQPAFIRAALLTRSLHQRLLPMAVYPTEGRATTARVPLTWMLSCGGTTRTTCRRGMRGMRTRARTGQPRRRRRCRRPLTRPIASTCDAATTVSHPRELGRAAEAAQRLLII
jgi:hypothetical protein